MIFYDSTYCFLISAVKHSHHIKARDVKIVSMSRHHLSHLLPFESGITRHWRILYGELGVFVSASLDKQLDKQSRCRVMGDGITPMRYHLFPHVHLDAIQTVFKGFVFKYVKNQDMHDRIPVLNRHCFFFACRQFQNQ